MANTNYKYNFIFKVYENMFINKTGFSFEQEELDYFIIFTQYTNYINSAKELENYALYILSAKSYPMFIVNYLVSRKAKNILINSNAPKRLIKLYKEFAHVAIVSAWQNIKLFKK